MRSGATGWLCVAMASIKYLHCQREVAVHSACLPFKRCIVHNAPNRGLVISIALAVFGGRTIFTCNKNIHHPLPAMQAKLHCKHLSNFI